ncbi:MAG: ABC transporter ATP-binding protein [Candidatus Thermoplasmatota archaeon]
MIEVRDLIKSYGSTRALCNVDFNFNDSIVTAIMGENGAGKSTLLKICAGVINFDCGEIFVDGLSLVNDSVKARRDIGYLPEMPYMYDRLTGREFLLYISSLRNFEDAEDEIDSLSSFLGISRFLDHEIGGYSKGMKQKISLISAIIHRPKNLLLDEPVWGLDPLTSCALRDFILKQKGTTVIATHSPSLVEEVADVVYFLSKGKVVSSGNVSSFTDGYGSIEDAYFHEAGIK